MKKKLILVFMICVTFVLCVTAAFYIKSKRQHPTDEQINQEESNDVREDVDNENSSVEGENSAIVQQYTFDESSPMPNVISVDGGFFSVVEDDLAEDGYALKGITAFSDEHSGIKIEFGDVRIETYDSIYINLRTTEYVDIVINDFETGYYGYKNYSEYKQIDILPFLLSKGETTLKSLQIGRRTKSNVEVYIDSISLIDIKYDKITYTFADGYDMNIVFPIYEDDGAIYERSQDNKAKDGYALKVTTENKTRLNGVALNFDNLDLSLYEAIYMRVRTKGTSEFYANDMSIRIAWKEYPEYTDIDILPFLRNAGATQLTSLLIGRQFYSGVEIYLDSVTFYRK